MPYNPFLVHTTIPLVIYENQRLDTRLKTVAISGAKFSAAGLGKQGRRAPFELKHPTPTEDNRTEFLPAWRSGIQLPLKSAPWVLPLPVTPSQAALESVERSHFWLYYYLSIFGHSITTTEFSAGQTGLWTSHIRP